MKTGHEKPSFTPRENRIKQVAITNLHAIQFPPKTLNPIQNRHQTK